MAQVDVTRIASNIGALNALNSLQNINKQLAIHQSRLSTGKRINSASDDPAGLTIATKMLARSEGLKVAFSNIGDASNMMSVAEAGLSKMNDILVIMRGKAEQAASDTLGFEERKAVQTQLSAFAAQIDDIVSQTKWNSTQLLDGTVSNLQFQTGVDLNENTTWSLAQDHSSTGLDISKVGTGTAVLQGNTGTTGAAGGNDAYNWVQDANGNVVSLVGTGAGTNSLTSLSTGRYQINVLDIATNATAGSTASAKYTESSRTSTLGTLAKGVADPGGVGVQELASGEGYTFKVNSSTGTSTANVVTWQIDNAAGNMVKAGTTTLANLGTAIDLNDGTNTIGLSLKKTPGTGLMTQADNFKFDYLRGGDMKYELVDAASVRQSIDVNGVTDTNGTASNGKVGFVSLDDSAETTVNTGRGLQFNVGKFANVAAANYKFDWEAVGNNVINVSTASLAASYMDKISSAIGVVSDSMASLGSLMARLDFKSEQVSNAQVNVEGAYSRIMNANMAEEQMNASKYTILQQTAVAMLAQANQAPQSLLTLFR